MLLEEVLLVKIFINIDKLLSVIYISTSSIWKYSFYFSFAYSKYFLKCLLGAPRWLRWLNAQVLISAEVMRWWDGALQPSVRLGMETA